MYEYLAKITKVIDGDTFDFEIDLGFGIKYSDRLRLFGIDTPEIRGSERDEGLKVKDYVKNLLEGENVILRTHKWKGKYGRYVASVFFPKTQQDLAKYLIEIGMGKAINYD